MMNWAQEQDPIAIQKFTKPKSEEVLNDRKDEKDRDCNHKRSLYTTGLFCIINKISFTIISLSSSDKFQAQAIDS